MTQSKVQTMDSKKRLYFFAIVPPEPVFSAVMEMKKHVSLNYESHAPLRSPSHITLIPPFWWVEDKEQELAEALDKFTSKQKAFPLRLNGFKAFPPRVIYVSNEKEQRLQDLYT